MATADNESHAQANGTSHGTKRKAEDSSNSSAKEPELKQSKLDDSFKKSEEGHDRNDNKGSDNEHADKAKSVENGEDSVGHEEQQKPSSTDDACKEQSNGHKQTNTAAADGNAVEIDKTREEAQPSNILEKGIIYFFTRGRVGVDDPNSVQDLARSYFVLRPLQAGAKLTEGAIPDEGNNRLIALPKKVWPKSGKDRFMAFVEKAKANMSTLKDEFFSGSTYSTKTVGTRQTPEVTPIGEGVYAITSTGSGRPTTHLVYMLSIPSEPSEVQTDMGLASKGSFVLSLKNPEAPGPASAQLPDKPDFPKEFIDEFSGRGWMPIEPKHLNYANAQMLLIGEDFESSSNLDATEKDEKSDEKETPREELEKLEEEDEHRIEALKGDDTIFADLGLDSKEYPKVMTTW